jgi:hypothetical protein
LHVVECNVVEPVFADSVAELDESSEGDVPHFTLTPEYRRNMVITPEIEVALREAGAQSPEECAARFYEVFGKGPRGYASDDIEAKFAADAQLPRAEIVAAMGEHMQAAFG